MGTLSGHQYGHSNCCRLDFEISLRQLQDGGKEERWQGGVKSKREEKKDKANIGDRRRRLQVMGDKGG